MSAPSIISSAPANGTTDVVLGTAIIVGFNQPMDTTTINDATFSLTGPGQSEVMTAGNLIAAKPVFLNGGSIVKGTFSFTSDTNGNTVLTFTPMEPLRPDVVYTILMVGSSQVTSASIKNQTGDSLDNNYQWTFTTGSLNVTIPPAQSPLPQLSIPLDPAAVQVKQQVFAVGNDLSQQIDIVFPGQIDTTSISPADILLSLEPILNDPTVQVPRGLTPTVTISGNKISITISGWPLT